MEDKTFYKVWNCCANSWRQIDDNVDIDRWIYGENESEVREFFVNLVKDSFFYPKDARFSVYGPLYTDKPGNFGDECYY